jgi:hypothetical protein
MEAGGRGCGVRGAADGAREGCAVGRRQPERSGVYEPRPLDRHARIKVERAPATVSLVGRIEYLVDEGAPAR